MNEFEIGGVLYRSGKLNAIEQFHVARRIAPIVAKMGALASLPALMSNGEDKAATTPSDIAAFFAPIADAIAELSDEDSERVISTCLGAVQRQQGPTWAPIWDKRNHILLFQDISLPTMMQIVMAVLQDNLAGFSSAPRSSSPPEPSRTTFP